MYEFRGRLVKALLLRGKGDYLSRPWMSKEYVDSRVERLEMLEEAHSREVESGYVKHLLRLRMLLDSSNIVTERG